MKLFYFLTVQDIIRLHDKSIERFGGAPGIRDIGLLESAAAQPSMFLFNKQIHETIFHMAAAYAFHIIKNHAFIDGNKRAGILAALTFLEKNNHIITTDPDTLYQLTLAIAQSEISTNEIATFFKESCTKSR